jgi:putative intracellular protease/amidase
MSEPAEPPFVIVVAIYPGVTQLDFTGPHTVFSRLPNVKVVVASAAGGAIASESGLVFAGTQRLADIERCDLLFTPGGVAVTDAINDAAFMADIRRLSTSARYLTSVCTGSLILGAAGLLQGRKAACHWAWRHLLPLFGALPDDARVVRDGNVITGGGVTAGIDFALVIAAELAGDQTAQAIQLGIEYAPAPPFDSGRPDTAPPEVLDRVKSGMAAFLAKRVAAAETAANRARESGIIRTA